MIHNIINGLGVTEVLNPEITAFTERSGSRTSSRSTTTTTADARYTIALPNGQTASNLTQTQYDTVKALLAIYNEAFALSKENGLPVPSWDTYDTLSNAQNALANLKAQIRKEDFAEALAKANAAIAYQIKVINTPYISADERAKDIRKAVEDAKDAFGERVYKEVILEGNNENVANMERQKAEDRYWLENYEYVRQAEMDAVNGKIGSNSSSLPFPEWIIEMQKNESAQTTPPEVVLPDNVPTVPTVQPPSEKQGSGILIPALIFAVGAIATIALVKTSNKKRR